MLFLTGLGVGNAQAIAVGLLWGGVMLVVSMAGAPAFMVGHRRASAPVPETAGKEPAVQEERR